MAKFLDNLLWPIIALAIVAVLVSQKSSTNTVIATVGTALSNILGAVVAPINSGTAASAATAATSTQTNVGANAAAASGNTSSTPATTSH